MGFDFDNVLSWQNLVALILSIMQLTAYWLVGNKNKAGWWLGIAGAVPWLIVMFAWDAWGLVVLVVGLQVTYVRNLLKWNRAEKEAAAHERA